MQPVASHNATAVHPCCRAAQSVDSVRLLLPDDMLQHVDDSTTELMTFHVPQKHY